MSEHGYRLGVLCLCVALAACSAAKKEPTYQGAASLPALEVPPDLITPKTDPATSVPPVSPRQSKQPVSAAPVTLVPSAETAAAVTAIPAAAATPIPTPVEVLRDGATRWLEVAAPRAQVWARARSYWASAGVVIAREDDRSGVLETEWIEAADPALVGLVRDKFRLRVETGRDAMRSEVYLSHQGLERVSVDGKPVWLPRATDDFLEAEHLERLRDHLTRNPAAQEAAEPLVELPAQVQANLQTGVDGQKSLQLNEDFPRAWRRTGLALQRAQFVIEDRNRSAGVFHIRVGEAFKQDKGFFGGLFGSDVAPHQRYRILVKEVGGRSLVTAMHAQEGPVSAATSERLLKKLHQHLE